MKKYYATFARDMGFRNPSNPPTLTDPDMMRSTQRRRLVELLLTATLSLRSLRNRINTGRNFSRWIVSQAFKNSGIKIIVKKMEDYSDSDSDYDAESDTITK